MKSHPRADCRPSPFKALAIGLASALLYSAAYGTDIAFLKSTGHWATAVPANFQMGDNIVTGPPNTLALSESWIAVGSPASADQGFANGGAVQVFTATGAWSRKILPPTGVAQKFFGASCAINGSGHMLVVGSPGPSASSPGVAYVYSLLNGTLLHTLTPGTPAAGVTGDLFGCAVAVSGSKVIVGAYGNSSQRGRIYVYDINTGLQLATMPNPESGGGTVNDRFGYSIAAEGNVAVVGAPDVDSNRGAGYAFDLTTFSYIAKFQPAASVSTDWVGTSIAMHGGKIALGAPGSNTQTGKVFVMGLLDDTQAVLTGSDAAAGDRLGQSVSTHLGLLVAGTPFQANSRGALYVFDINSSSANEIQKIIPPDGGTSRFGLGVAIVGNQAVVTAPQDSTQANQAGAIVLMSPILRQMPLTKVTAQGDFAPGVVEANFSTIGDAFLNSDGEVAFASSTNGTGNNGGNGVWNTLAPSQPLDLVLKVHLLDGGLPVASVSTPMINNAGLSIFKGTLGAPATSLNNQAIYKDDGTVVTRILRTGDPQAAFNMAQPVVFDEAVQSHSVDRVPVISYLKVGSGTPATTASTDSGLLWYDVATNSSEAQREGSNVPLSSLIYGQFAPRVAAYWDNVAYCTAIAPPTVVGFNQAIFQKVNGGAVTMIAQKGLPAPVITPTTNFSSFIGESSDDGERVLYRATLAAPAIATNNEALFLYSPGSPPINTLVVRKGSLVYGLPGVTISSFINYWQSGGSTLVYAALGGTANTTNNRALILYSNIPVIPPLVLMRTGDPAPGFDAETIAVILKVQVEPKNAHYMVLARLQNAPAGTDIVLYRGFANKPIGSNFAALTLRRPVPVLRKGHLFLNQPGKITSMDLPISNISATGAGNTGRGAIMRRTVDGKTPNTAVISVDFANGVHQVMKGIP